MKFYDMYFEDVYSLFCNDETPYSNIEHKKYLITAKNSRNVIKHYISKDSILLFLLNAFIYLSDVVIIGDLIMCVRVKYPSLPKPQLIKIPKPTSLMVKKFYYYLMSINLEEALDNLQLQMHGMYLANVKIKLTHFDLKKLQKSKNIYYDLYNNALKSLGNRYITKYEKIKTFYDGAIDTNQFIKGMLIASLPKDIIKYICEFVPYIYTSHHIYKISPNCKKCYNKYHAGIVTNYHQVDGSRLCGLCNEDKENHKFSSQICPARFRDVVCICTYTTFCICKTFNLSFSHDIFMTRYPTKIMTVT
jgi:hypothetical protein